MCGRLPPGAPDHGAPRPVTSVGVLLCSRPSDTGAHNPFGDLPALPKVADGSYTKHKVNDELFHKWELVPTPCRYNTLEGRHKYARPLSGIGLSYPRLCCFLLLHSAHRGAPAPLRYLRPDGVLVYTVNQHERNESCVAAKSAASRRGGVKKRDRMAATSARTGGLKDAFNCLNRSMQPRPPVGEWRCPRRLRSPPQAPQGGLCVCRLCPVCPLARRALPSPWSRP